MKNQDSHETHVGTNEARAGRRTKHMPTVFTVSTLLAAVVLLTVLGVFAA